MSLTSLAKSIRKLATEAVGAKQPALAGLIGEWREVVGAEWASRCVPMGWKAGRGDRLATLELAVSGGTAPLVQHELPTLESRINAYFGYRAIGTIRLKQVERLPQPKIVRERAEVVPVAVDIEDEELALALGRLGAAVGAKG